MTSAKTVVVDCFQGGRLPYEGHELVAIDVLRATTTCVTAVSLGRRCLVGASTEEALSLAASLDDPLLAGEVHGHRPDGFELQNSPAALAARADTHRPLVLVSTSGTPLLRASAGASTYAACLRNRSATVRALLRDEPSHVAAVGAGSRGEFREEDEICAAWIAGALVDAGYEPLDERTGETIARWRGATTDAIASGRSADYLRRSGQLHDLEFVLAHDDDVDGAFVMRGAELAAA